MKERQTQEIWGRGCMRGVKSEGESAFITLQMGNEKQKKGKRTAPTVCVYVFVIQDSENSFPQHRNVEHLTMQIYDKPGKGSNNKTETYVVHPTLCYI